MKLPSYFMIEPTSICNLNCLPCSRKNMIANGQLYVGSMHNINLINLLDRLPAADHIRFHGMGELFLLENHIVLLSILRDYNYNSWIELVTNGQYENTDEKNVVRLCNRITFSFDGWNKESYEKIRCNGKYNIIKRNIRRFLKYKDKIKIELNFVCASYNYSNAVDMVKIANSLGVKNIRFNIVQDWTGTLDKEVINIDIDDFVNNIKEAKEKAVKLGINLNISGNPDFNESQCEWMNERVYINFNGDILPCCMRPELKYKVGNIFEQSLAVIWNSPLITGHRKLMKEENNSFCKNCPYIINKKILEKL